MKWGSEEGRDRKTDWDGDGERWGLGKRMIWEKGRLRKSRKRLRNKGEDQKRVTEKERWWIAGEVK